MSELHPFRDLYDAAIRCSAARIECRCGHVVIVHAAGLWRLFNRNGWNDRFAHVRRRLYCRRCWANHGIKRRPKLDFSDEEPTWSLLPPAKDEWAREARRRR